MIQWNRVGSVNKKLKAKKIGGEGAGGRQHWWWYNLNYSRDRPRPFIWSAALAIAVLVGHAALFVVHAQTWPAVSTVGAGDRISWLFKTCPPLRTASTGSLTAILLGSFAAAFSHRRSLSAEFQLPNWFGDGTGLFFFFPQLICDEGF